MEILEEARWSPSWGNTQPWDLYVLTGKTLAKFKEMNLQQSLAGAAIASDVPMLEKWPDAMKAGMENWAKLFYRLRVSEEKIRKDVKSTLSEYGYHV